MKGGSLLDGFQNESEYDQWIGLKNDLVSSTHFFLRYEASFSVMITIKTKTKYQNIKNLHSDLCWRRQWHPTPVLLPGKSHGRRSLVGCSPWGREESDTTERLDFYFSLSCTGEGNGNPLQCSCLENPRDGGDWWAAVYGVAQSRTRLKRLGSRPLYFHIASCSSKIKN